MSLFRPVRFPRRLVPACAILLAAALSACVVVRPNTLSCRPDAPGPTPPVILVCAHSVVFPELADAGADLFPNAKEVWIVSDRATVPSFSEAAAIEGSVVGEESIARARLAAASMECQRLSHEWMTELDPVLREDCSLQPGRCTHHIPEVFNGNPTAYHPEKLPFDLVVYLDLQPNAREEDSVPRSVTPPERETWAVYEPSPSSGESAAAKPVSLFLRHGFSFWTQGSADPARHTPLPTGEAAKKTPEGRTMTGWGLVLEPTGPRFLSGFQFAKAPGKAVAKGVVRALTDVLTLPACPAPK